MKKLALHESSYQGEPKKSHRFATLLSGLACIICFLFTTTASAQIPSNCGTPNCTSNDVQIIRAYLTDLSNQPLSCISGQNITAYRLHLVLSTKTPRVGVFINCKLNLTPSGGSTTTIPVSNCFGVALQGDNNDLSVDF